MSAYLETVKATRPMDIEEATEKGLRMFLNTENPIPAVSESSDSSSEQSETEGE